MQELVDTHCHIQSIGLKVGERTTRELWAKASSLTGQGVVMDAVKHGVTRLVCVGCDLVDSRLAIQFAHEHQNCWAAIGLHPHEARHYENNKIKLENFARLVDEPKVVAIGECGLDYYYNHSSKEAQTKVLEYQMKLAQRHNLPLIFHVRDAFDDFWPIFDSFSGLKAVLHSFTDSASNMAKALERDLFIGVNGIATFAKDPKQLEVYRKIPLKNLLLETDSPFLTPSPYRGNINEPRRVGTVADFLANLRGENRAELAKKTTANARQLFGI